MKVFNTHKTTFLLKLKLIILACLTGLLVFDAGAHDWRKWDRLRREMAERIREYRNRSDVKAMAKNIQMEAAENGHQMSDDGAEYYAANLQFTLDILTPVQRAEVLGD